MTDSDIHRIINLITNILTNEEHAPLNVLGGELVGLIGALDNIEIIYEHYPQLEVIANRGTELKLSTDETHSKQLIDNINGSLSDLRKLVSVNG